MHFNDFRQILTNLSVIIDGQPRPSANNNREDGPRPADSDGSPLTEAWWRLKRVGTHPGKSRTQAYLTAYVAASGGRIPAEGIALQDGYIWPDRDIMKSLLVGRLVQFTAIPVPAFELTEAGLQYLRAPSQTYTA